MEQSTTQVTDGGVEGFIVYSVGRSEFAVRLGDVREVIGRPAVKPVPRAHPFLEGVFELRERILPLCNMRRWLDIDGIYAAGTKVIVCEFATTAIGLWVDEVQRIYRPEPGAVRPLFRLEPYTDLLLGTVQLGRRLALLLNYAKLVETVRPAVAALPIHS